MNYKLIYENLVERGQLRTSIVGYKERHHIIPRCMGGSDDASNLVELTPEEHFVAHQLLVKIYPNNLRLVRACDVMSKDTKVNKYWRKNKMYGWLRRRLHVPKIKIICKHCQHSFEALKCSKRIFCSQNCKSLSQQNKVTLCCKQCQKYFAVIESKSKKRQYCSPECSATSQQIHKIKKCEYCNSTIINAPYIIKKRKFCSKECTNSSRKGKSCKPTRFALVISKPCAQCNGLIYGKPGVLKQRIYCSIKCRSLSQKRS
jgi:hypothetical protein